MQLLVDHHLTALLLLRRRAQIRAKMLNGSLYLTTAAIIENSI
jgi:hypothetical protein